MIFFMKLITGYIQIIAPIYSHFLQILAAVISGYFPGGPRERNVKVEGDLRSAEFFTILSYLL